MAISLKLKCSKKNWNVTIEKSQQKLLIKKKEKTEGFKRLKYWQKIEKTERTEKTEKAENTENMRIYRGIGQKCLYKN